MGNQRQGKNIIRPEDFKESFINKTNLKILNIKKLWIAIPLLICFNLLFLFFFVGFFVFPFISYNNLISKIIFSVFWVVGALIIISFIATKTNTGENSALTKIATICLFLVTFSLIFIHNNYLSFGNTLTIIIFILLAIIILFSIMVLILIAKTQPTTFLHSTIFFVVSSVFFIVLYQAMHSQNQEELKTKYIGIISFFAIVALLLGLCLMGFLKHEKFRYMYLYSVIVFGAISILFSTSYVINYFDNSKSFLDIFVTLLAAAIGGGITLLGVALTIRKGDEDRKRDREQLEKDRQEEERKKAMPYLQFFAKHNDDMQSISAGGVSIKYNENIIDPVPRTLYFKNISDTIFILDHFIIGNEIYELEKKIVGKNQYFVLNLEYDRKQSTLAEIMEEMYIVGRDVLDNYYSYRVVKSNSINTNIYTELPKLLDKTDLEKKTNE